MKRIRPKDFVVPVLFGCAAVLTGVHAAPRLSHALHDPTARAWLDAFYDILRTLVAAMFTVFTIGRSVPRRRARSLVAFAACAVAMGGTVAFTDPPQRSPDILVLAGEVVAVAGVGWILLSVLFLRRCFGILPEARGLVRRGPYSVVRHPVYLGEIAAFTGLAIAAPALANLVTLVVVVAAQLVRMRLEENALQTAFPEYRGYAESVPRILPSLRPLLPRRAVAR
jgi:protein-S-isoprenylcysteine O-methyltransferase Ste14